MMTSGIRQLMKTITKSGEIICIYVCTGSLWGAGGVCLRVIRAWDLVWSGALGGPAAVRVPVVGRTATATGTVLDWRS